MADLIIVTLGTTPLTIALVVALAMTAAIALGGEALFVSQAATSATLVATLPLSDHFTLARAVDAFAGGAVALAVGFLLLPLDPVRLARSAAHAVLDELGALLEDLGAAMQMRDRDGEVDAVGVEVVVRGVLGRPRAPGPGRVGERLARVQPRRRRRVRPGRAVQDPGGAVPGAEPHTRARGRPVDRQRGAAAAQEQPLRAAGGRYAAVVLALEARHRQAVLELRRALHADRHLALEHLGHAYQGARHLVADLMPARRRPAPARR